MIKKYIYGESTYLSEPEVHQAIFADKRVVFGESPAEGAASWWAKHGVTYVEEDDPVPPEPTPEELAKAALDEAKRVRAEAVEKIKVDVDGMSFDGDEVAQGRMARTIAAAVAEGADLDKTTMTWVLADNTVAQPTVAQLAKALRLAGERQTELWTAPYESSEE